MTGPHIDEGWREFCANPPERHVCGICGRRHYRRTFLQYDHDEMVKDEEARRSASSPEPTTDNETTSTKEK